MPNFYEPRLVSIHRQAELGSCDGVRFFLNKGIDVDIRNQYGHTALMVATNKGHTEVVKILLEAGANPNVTMYNGSALTFATRNRFVGIVRLLVNARADLDYKDKDGETALRLAKKYGYTELIPILENRLITPSNPNPVLQPTIPAVLLPKPTTPALPEIIPPPTRPKPTIYIHKILAVCLILTVLGMIVALFIPHGNTNSNREENRGSIAKIYSSDAKFHIGEFIIVCGNVAQVREMNIRTIINLGQNYPKEDIGLIIWDDDRKYFENAFSNLEWLTNRHVCASGTIEIYRDRIQMKITSPRNITVMNQ